MRYSSDLDAIDLKLLQLVQEHGRMQIGALAEEVGLSAPAAGERLRKLEERGVVRGYAAQVDPATLALDIAAFIMVRVDSSAHYPKFLAKVAEHPEVLECHAITGDASHLLKIRTRNTATLETLLGVIQRWPGVIGTRTSLVLSTHKETVLLPYTHIADIVEQERGARGQRRG